MVVLPETTARTLSQWLPITIYKTPQLGESPFYPTLYWHESKNADPANQWLRSIIISHTRSSLGNHPTVKWFNTLSYCRQQTLSHLFFSRLIFLYCFFFPVPSVRLFSLRSWGDIFFVSSSVSLAGYVLPLNSCNGTASRTHNARNATKTLKSQLPKFLT